MNKDEKILMEMVNLGTNNGIYYELFDKTRDELIIESFAKWQSDLLLMHDNNIDEMMHDFMTIDALKALNRAVKSVKMALVSAPISDVMSNIGDYVRQYRLNADKKLWEWE